MRKFLAGIALLLALLVGQAACAQSGFFLLPRADITSPVTDNSVTFDPTNPQWYYWNGTAWVGMSFPQSNFTASVAPTVNDDNTEGYANGSVWIDTTSSTVYWCLSAATGAAVWQATTPVGVVNKFTTADAIGDFLVSGLVGSVPSVSLTMTTPSGAAYVTGLRLTPGATTFTYTASKDTYEFLQSDDTFIHHAVNNGDPPPSDTGLLISKVITNGTQITAVNSLASLYPTLNCAAAGNNNQAISLGQGNALYLPYSLYTAQGDLIVGGPSGFVILNEGGTGTLLGRVPVGLGLQYYTLVGTNGISVTPSGTNMTISAAGIVPSDGGALTTNTNLTAVTVSTSYTTTGTITITMPTASSGLNGMTLTFINIGTGTITYSPSSGNINGASTYTNGIQYQSDSFRVIDGAWYAI